MATRTREIIHGRPFSLVGRVFAGGCGDQGDCVSSPGPSDDDGDGGGKRMPGFRRERIGRLARPARIK